MNNKFTGILKEKPIVIPRFIFNNYKKLGITEEELVILIFIIDFGGMIVYNPDLFVHELSMDKYRVMELINNLSIKNVINIKVQNNDDGKMEEYIDIDLFYNRMSNLLLEEEKEVDDNTEIYSIFEEELGRTISPMEIEKITEWIKDDFSEELIIEALKEAVFKNARTLNYVNSILYSWKQKGIKNVNQARNEKMKFRNSKREVQDVFDYNWLEDE